MSFYVIPAEAGIQSRSERDQRFIICWTPIFIGVTTFYQFISKSNSKDAMQKIHPSNLSLGSQAYQELKRIILGRQISPGENLNEGELAGALGVSRTPVREAINRLEKEGLVEIIPQRGAFVVQVSAKDVWELFLIRENLEGLAAKLAAERMDEKNLARLESCVHGFTEPFSQQDIRRYAREDFRFHQTIVSLSEAKRLIQLVSSLHDQIRMFRLTTVGLSGRMKTSLAEHRGMIESFRKENPEECERKMREHIRHVRDGVMKNIAVFLNDGGKQSEKSKEERVW